MSEAMYLAASGAIVQQMRLEVLSNNLSNINTTGFKEDRTVFKAYLPVPPDIAEGNLRVALISGKPGVSPPYLPSNFHVTFDGTKTDFSPGRLKYTGNDLDLAIKGRGFFCVAGSKGIQYTRKGDFTLNKEGLLVTQEGLPVLGKKGVIKIEGEDISVNLEGNIMVDGDEIDTIRVVDFPQPYVMEKIGDTFFVPVDPRSPVYTALDASVNQGCIEGSNVNAIKMMTEMIEVLRAYESYQKAIQSANDSTLKAINEVGKLA